MIPRERYAPAQKIAVQRLTVHYGFTPKLTTLGEVAEIGALCSRRHARTLLRQLSESGWLSWRAQAGRGHRATLHCLVTTSELSAPLMHACALEGYQVRCSWRMAIRPSLHTSSPPFSAANG